jgi:hypothetical protein
LFEASTVVEVAAAVVALGPAVMLLRKEEEAVQTRYDLRILQEVVGKVM